MRLRAVSPTTDIASSPDAWEELAKRWLIEVIDRSPLAEVGDLPLAWITREAPAMIAEVLGQLSDPGPPRDVALPPATLERAASLAIQRPAAESARLLPRELAALQSLLIEAVERDLPDRDRRSLAGATARLAEVFGAVLAAAIAPLAADEEAEASLDPETGLPGEAQLVARLSSLIADSNRTGAPFTVAHFEIDGIERIAKGYSEDAAGKMAAAVAGILRGQLGPTEPVYRVGPGQLIALAPGNASTFQVRARKIIEVVGKSQSPRGPRVEMTVGLAAHPGVGHVPADLMDAADEAAWSARASGRDVDFAGVAALQDR